MREDIARGIAAAPGTRSQGIHQGERERERERESETETETESETETETERQRALPGRAAREPDLRPCCECQPAGRPPWIVCTCRRSRHTPTYIYVLAGWKMRGKIPKVIG